MPKKNQPGCGCCGSIEVDCVEDSDDFNRPDASDPGAKWTEVSGTWPIAGNQLTTSSTNAVATFQHVNSSGDDNFKASVRVKGAVGDRLRLIYRQDSSNYVAAELVIGNYGTLNLIANDGSGEDVIATQFAMTEPDTWYTLHLCVTDLDAEMYFGASVDDGPTLGDVHDSGAWTAPEWGLGTGSTAGSVAFDDMTVYKCNAQCPCCGGSGTGGCSDCCDDGDLPRYFLLRVPGLSDSHCDRCTDLETVVLERDPDSLSCIWAWTLESDGNWGSSTYSATFCETTDNGPGYGDYCVYGLRLWLELYDDPFSTDCILKLHIHLGRFAAAWCSIYQGGCTDVYELAFTPTENCLSGTFTLTSGSPCVNQICGDWPSTLTIEGLG